MRRDIRLHDTSPRLGEAWFPSVVRNVPGLHGLLLRVQAGPNPRGDDPSHTAPDQALSAAVHAWIAGLLGVGDPRVLDLPDLRVTVPPVGVAIDGPSAQLSALVALISHVLGRSPREPAICTGQLGAPGFVTGVEDTTTKRLVLALEAPGQPCVVLESPKPVPAPLERWFGPRWRQDIEDTLRLSPHALVGDAWRSYDAGARGVAEVKAREAARIGVGHTRARAEWLLGACRVHRGEATPGLDLMLRAENALLAPAGPGDAPLEAHLVEELRAYRGIALIDLWAVREARGLLQATLERLAATPQTWCARTAWVLLQVAGSLHRACVLDGDLETAAAVLRHWNLGAALLPEQEARSHGDLAEVLRRAGDIQAAREELVRALECLPVALDGTRPMTRRFLDLYRARVGLDRARWRVEPPRWQHWPQPAEVLETLLTGPPADLDDWVCEHVLNSKQQDALTACLIAAGAAARCEAATGARLRSTSELVHRIVGCLPDLDPGLRAALEALAAGDPVEWLRRCPY